MTLSGMGFLQEKIMKKPIAVMLLILGASIANAFAASQEITLETTAGTLSVTLETPSGAGLFPVALIIAGSGPTDRDGNSLAGVKTDMYKLVAQGLAQNGIASLRYDKRGVGKSTLKDRREENLRFDEFVSDAVSLLGWLERDARFGKRFIIGHSEGSLIGMLAAQRAKVDGFISLAGAGRPIDVVLLEQLSAQLPAPMLEESKRVMSELKAGRTVPESQINLPDQIKLSLFRASVQPYLISWFSYDPALEVVRLTCRVLVVQGSTDVQVSLEDARRLAGALKTQPVLIEGMNHVLKRAPAGAANQQAAYSDPSLPLMPGLLETLVAFIMR
jgi:hypothetical protein